MYLDTFGANGVVWSPPKSIFTGPNMAFNWLIPHLPDREALMGNVHTLRFLKTEFGGQEQWIWHGALIRPKFTDAQEIWQYDVYPILLNRSMIVTRKGYKRTEMIRLRPLADQGRPLNVVFDGLGQLVPLIDVEEMDEVRIVFLNPHLDKQDYRNTHAIVALHALNGECHLPNEDIKRYRQRVTALCERK